MLPHSPRFIVDECWQGTDDCGRLVVVAVFCLCIGHPGFVFKDRKGKEDYKGVPMTQEHVVLMENKQTAYVGA